MCVFVCIYMYACTRICEADCQQESTAQTLHHLGYSTDTVAKSSTAIIPLDDSVNAEHEAGGEGKAAC
jgi:hypothetical protein